MLEGKGLNDEILSVFPLSLNYCVPLCGLTRCQMPFGILSTPFRSRLLASPSPPKTSNMKVRVAQQLVGPRGKSERDLASASAFPEVDSLAEEGETRRTSWSCGCIQLEALFPWRTASAVLTHRALFCAQLDGSPTPRSGGRAQDRRAENVADTILLAAQLLVSNFSYRTLSEPPSSAHSPLGRKCWLMLQRPSTVPAETAGVFVPNREAVKAKSAKTFRAEQRRQARLQKTNVSC